MSLVMILNQMDSISIHVALLNMPMRFDISSEILKLNRGVFPRNQQGLSYHLQLIPIGLETLAMIYRLIISMLFLVK